MKQMKIKNLEKILKVTLLAGVLTMVGTTVSYAINYKKFTPVKLREVKKEMTMLDKNAGKYIGKSKIYSLSDISRNPNANEIIEKYKDLMSERNDLLKDPEIIKLFNKRHYEFPMCLAGGIIGVSSILGLNKLREKEQEN